MAAHDDLLETARAQTGLTDFGDDSFRDGLERLVRAMRDEAKLNAVGAVAIPHLVVNLLAHRLQVEDWYRRHPEIDDEPIDAPLVGLGLPRTGSTALSFLLAEDPGARSLRKWEAVRPCPPPSTVEGPDPRIAQAEHETTLQEQMAPRLSALVPSTATGPEECQDLMALDFKAQYFQAFAHIPSYSDWLVDADLTSTYAYERRVLKMLQWGEHPKCEPPKPWRLKCPSHMLWLEHLDRAFPDARFVMTHRDPTEVLVSVADLYAEVGRQFSGRRRCGASSPSATRAPITASTTSTSAPSSAIRSARSAASTRGSANHSPRRSRRACEGGGSSTPRRANRTSTRSLPRSGWTSTRSAPRSRPTSRG
jgi:hypothetical protein